MRIDLNNIEVLDIEEFSKKKKKNYIQVIFIILILLLIILFGIGLFLFLRFARDNTKDVNLNYIEVEVGTTLSTDIKDYANVAKKCKLDTSGVDTNTEGKYKYNIKCNKKTYTGDIKVYEKTKDFTVKPISIELGQNFIVNDLLIDNSKSTFTIENMDKINNMEIGSYLALIKKTTDEDSVYKYSLVNVSNTKVKKIISARKKETSKVVGSKEVIYFIGINEYNYHTNMTRVYIYSFENDEDYNNFISTYSDSKTLYELKENKQIYLLENLDLDDMNLEFGNFPSTADMIINRFKEINYIVKED